MMLMAGYVLVMLLQAKVECENPTGQYNPFSNPRLLVVLCDSVTVSPPDLIFASSFE